MVRKIATTHHIYKFIKKIFTELVKENPKQLKLLKCKIFKIIKIL